MKIRDKIKEYKTEKDATQKQIDGVLSKRSTGTRARAAYDLWLKLNPTHKIGYSDGTVAFLTARQIHRETLKKVAHLRELQRNKYGTNESQSMRIGLELSPHAMLFIQMFHPDIFDNDPDSKTRFSKLVREFKEFQVAEVW